MAIITLFFITFIIVILTGYTIFLIPRWKLSGKKFFFTVHLLTWLVLIILYKCFVYQLQPFAVSKKVEILQWTELDQAGNVKYNLKIGSFTIFEIHIFCADV